MTTMTIGRIEEEKVRTGPGARDMHVPVLTVVIFLARAWCCFFLKIPFFFMRDPSCCVGYALDYVDLEILVLFSAFVYL